MTNDEKVYAFKTSAEAQEAILYSSDRAEVESATRFLLDAERYENRLTAATKAQLEVGYLYVPLRRAQGPDQVAIQLHELVRQYGVPFKPKEILVVLRAWGYLRQLKK